MPEEDAAEPEADDPETSAESSEDTNAQAGQAGGSREGRANDITYAKWIANAGSKWKLPVEGGPNWLGMAVGQDETGYGLIFPKNPSFRPPTPLSNADRNTIFAAWQRQPGEVTVRELSAKYGISLDRINAVIKLKQYEVDWLKKQKEAEDKQKEAESIESRGGTPRKVVIVPPLQTALCSGMEKYMGITDRLKRTARDAEEELAYNVDEDASYVRAHADEMSSSRTIIWELIEEGDQSIIATEMEMERSGKAQKLAKARRKLENPPTVRVPPAKPGRPTWVFTDVGDKFSNTREKEVAQHAARWKATVQRQRRHQQARPL
ncbi:hypothetical protein CALVIDRAFT_567054 [Calocera viscosa TUFC12733]|uniref:Uncharacterized protein n=1 Tax=Calocera viscosa (strain TUFC12733) TaxID=1330018 RepID=A0A167ILI7_CALVF|nr:hypothetical protein CALVIDRAFT_567054 [Calocera viscosa TUFC12733]